MADLRSVGRHTLVYGAGMAVSKLVSFLMLPVYTHYLTPGDFGILELLETTVDVIGMIAGMGVAAGVFKYFAEMQTTEEKKELLSTVLLANAAVSLVVMCLGIVFADHLNGLIFGGHARSLYFRIFFVSYFFQSFGNLGMSIVRVKEESGLFVGVTLAKLFVTLSLNIWFVVFLRAGLVGVLAGNLIGSALMAIGLAAYSFRSTGLHFSVRALRTLWKFGAPVGVSTVCSFILTFSDRYYLNHYRGASAVGVYSLAYSFAFLLSTVAVTPFMQIWEPRRFAIAREADAVRTYRKMFRYFNLFLFLVAIVIVLFIKDVLTVMVAPAFVAAYQVVPLLLITTIVQQWTWYTNFGLFLKEATGVLGGAGVLAAACALGLNWLLIPRYGMAGAAWATLFAYVVRFVPTYLASQSRYHVSYEWGKVLMLAAVLLAVLLIRYLANGLSVPASVAVSVTTLPIVGFYLHSRLLDGSEREQLRRLTRQVSSLMVIRRRQ